MSNKALYPTFGRTVPPSTEIVRALMALLEKFDWNLFTVIHYKSTLSDAILDNIKVGASCIPQSILQ